MCGDAVNLTARSLVSARTSTSPSSSCSNNNQVLDLSEDDRDVEEELLDDFVVPALPDSGAITAPYWVSLTRKKGFRRLHRAGGCHCVAVHFEEVHDLTNTVFNSKCGHCWRLGKREVATKISSRAAEDSDSSVSTSGESSSTSGE